jgi:hypothetical protein
MSFEPSMSYWEPPCESHEPEEDDEDHEYLFGKPKREEEDDEPK